MYYLTLYRKSVTTSQIDHKLVQLPRNRKVGNAYPKIFKYSCLSTKNLLWGDKGTCNDLLERVFIHELSKIAETTNNPNAQPQETRKINDDTSLQWNSMPPVKLTVHESSHALMEKCQLAHLLGKTVWLCRLKRSIHLPHEPAFTSRYVPNRTHGARPQKTEHSVQ